MYIRIDHTNIYTFSLYPMLPSTREAWSTLAYVMICLTGLFFFENTRVKLKRYKNKCQKHTVSVYSDILHKCTSYLFSVLK